MEKFRKMLPYLLVIILAFYLLPFLIIDTGSGMFILLLVIPITCFIVSFIYGIKNLLNWLFILLVSLKEVTIGADIREKIAKVYGSVPEIILKILTKSPSPELFDENESRTLSVREVLNMEEDNGVPFKSKGIIPIADKGDNDFIVYDGQAKIWAMYNIADELLFDQKESFEDLFLA